ELVKAALERGRAEFLSGSIACYEALSKPTLESAVAVFIDWGVLEQSEDEKTVSLAEAHRAPEATDGLAEQIARFLG
ncbi:MAG TPA: hypothetical protein DFS52_09670, partial [Myxococcales bacterium]|nr:hypothetical protein [Myxococcales bacterium]